MAFRPSMANLVARLRLLIGDPLSASVHYTDEQLQDVLDAQAEDLVQVPLTAIAQLGAGYPAFVADRGSWEADVVLQDAALQTVTPTGSDLVRGSWTFSPPRSSSVLYATGRVFDVPAAAADALEAWAASLARAYDFTQADGSSFRRGQQSAALQALARTYRAQQRPRTVPLMRSDA